jgi:hypothetical protein
MHLRILPSLLFAATNIAPTNSFSFPSAGCRRRGLKGVTLLVHGSEILQDETTSIHSNSNSNIDDIDDYDDHDVVEEDHVELSSLLDTMEIKRRLLDLLPRMKGTPEEFKAVESYVNELEDRYTPVQTLGFLNLAMSGDWQLLFSTNISGMPKSNFRLRELYQRIESNDLSGKVINEATWDLADNHGPTFDCSGSFTIKCCYTINQGARMLVALDDHVLELAKGSAVPNDFQALVGLLHRAIPTELFDPSEHAMDTTYIDGDLRIVRMTGPRFEAIRDIFIRRGCVEISPV